MLVSEQIRAARMLLRWEQRDLAERSGVSLPTIKRLETRIGEVQAHASTLDAIRRALSDGGVDFIDSGEASPFGGAGVRFKESPLAEILRKSEEACGPINGE